MRVLDTLAAAEGGMTVAELSRAVDRSRGATYRLLNSLHEAGMVMRDGNGGFLLGPRLLELARRMQQQSRIVELAGPLLTELRNEFDETAFVSAIAGTSILTLDEAVSRQPLRFSRGVGAADPIHTGATGRALLATLDEQAREELFERLEMRAYTPITITVKDDLRRAVAEVAETGFAISFGEYIVGVTAVACPVRPASGRPGAALTILGPGERFTEERALAARPQLSAAASRLAGLL